ncbi:MAG: TraR/DksA family transcriptional regulator [Acidimicrobiia bacterium]
MNDLRRSLIDRKAELQLELDRLTAPPTSGAAVSFGKRVGDGTTEAVERLSTTATARSITHTIEDIDRALAKLDDGTYGTCDVCGQQIGAARLEALPAASRCVSCASRD